jgi:hypothetical protein
MPLARLQIALPEPQCSPRGPSSSLELPDSDRILGDLPPPCLFSVTFVTKSQAHCDNCSSGESRGGILRALSVNVADLSMFRKY